MTDTHRLRLFLVSALALFLELALIRYLGSEVRIFAYYKNLVLIACFLGFGLGFYRAASKPRLGLSLAVLSAFVALINLSTFVPWKYGPMAATDALSNFAGSLTMGEQTAYSAFDATLVVGFGWALALFMASLVAMFGFAQRIGADIEAFGAPQRLAAYSLNVAGSLAGIAAFALVSRLAIGPVFWFAPVLWLALPLLSSRPARLAALLGGPVLALACIQLPHTIWSPYQRLNLLQLPPDPVQVMVNGTSYMSLQSFRDKDPNAVDRWRLPHTLYPTAGTALIVGAGGGNDVSAALQAGATRVVAVDIDPEILKLGRELHPDHPYSDPRVHVVVDDARHYGEKSDERFDLIVFSHLDSHTALSGFTNVRLDNYIYTVESFRTFSRLLKPTGLLYVSFFATRSWVAERLRHNLDLAFGTAPVPLYTSISSTFMDAAHAGATQTAVLNAHFIVTQDPLLRARAERMQRAVFEPPPTLVPPPASTDDWPYLFSEQRVVPTPMLILAIMLALITGGVIAVQVRRELRTEGRWPIDRHYFFLGAGFLLVEVHNVGKLARAFGTTWLVNAWVIAAVLIAILVANALVARWPKHFDPRLAYVGLLVCLVAGANVPIEALLALPGAGPLVTLFYTLPLFFAGVIFARSFQVARKPMQALGSNLLGSLLGGFLELASFVIGLSGLLYIAAILYLASYPGRAAQAD